MRSGCRAAPRFDATRSRAAPLSKAAARIPLSPMQHPRAPRNETDNCQELAPFVMALFDGEADANQAQRARAHLLVCQTCAHRWLDWNRSRDLLRSVPVPAPPPTLLWRVLMACRVASLPQKTAANTAAPDLSRQILARTTRSQNAAATPHAERASRRAAQRATLGRVSAWAVPALGLWLIALQRDTLFRALTPPAATVPIAVSRPVTRRSAPEIVPTIAVPRRIAARSVARQPEQPVPVAAPRAKTVEAHQTEAHQAETPRNQAAQRAPRWAPLVRDVSSTKAEGAAEAPSSRIAATLTDTPVENATPRSHRAALRAASFETDATRAAARWAYVSMAPAMAPQQMLSARTASAQPVAAQPVAARTLPVRVLSNRSTSRRAQLLAAISTAPAAARGRISTTARAATLSPEGVPDSEPSLRAARWKTSPSRLSLLAQSDTGPSRVSAPPRLTLAALPAAMGAARRAEPDGDDARVQEMQLAVADFRATLAPQDLSSDEDGG